MEEAQQILSSWDTLSGLLQKDMSLVLQDLANIREGIRIVHEPMVKLIDESVTSVKEKQDQLPKMAAAAKESLESWIANDTKEVNAVFAVNHASEASAHQAVIDQKNEQLFCPETALCFILQEVQEMLEMLSTKLRTMVKHAAARYRVKLAVTFNDNKVLNIKRFFHLI